MFKYFLIFILISLPAIGNVKLSVEDALNKYFPGYEIKNKKLFLSKENIEKLSAKAESKFSNRIFSYYEASKNGQRVYTAYLITHKLRTRTQTMFIVLKQMVK